MTVSSGADVAEKKLSPELDNAQLWLLYFVLHVNVYGTVYNTFFAENG